jgi:hypothetical protein
MGDSLIETGIFQNIIIVNASIGESIVSDWVDSGPLVKRL